MWYMFGYVTDEDMVELLAIRQELEDRQDMLRDKELEFVQHMRDVDGNLTSSQAGYLRAIHDRGF